MWGNALMSDLSRKTLISLSPMRLGPRLMGILAASFTNPWVGHIWDAMLGSTMGAPDRYLSKGLYEAGLGPTRWAALQLGIFISRMQRRRGTIVSSIRHPQCTKCPWVQHFQPWLLFPGQAFWKKLGSTIVREMKATYIPEQACIPVASSSREGQAKMEFRHWERCS